MNKLAITVIAVLAMLVACKKDDDKGPDNSSRTIRYEVTGNFTGSLYASYTTAAGGTANEQVSSLPWNKEVSYGTNVTAAIIAVSGNGGVAGQQVTVVIRRGGNQVGAPMAVVANGSGGFSKAAPVVVF